MQINRHFLEVADSYLFSTIAHKVNQYTAANPDKRVIRLGIGDVTRPLAPAVIDALHAAVDDMSKAETFHGYGPEQGYDFLKQSLQDYYASHGVKLDLEEIFVSDGAKSDVGNILDIFGADNLVLVPDPVYPVYVDTNVMAGRKVQYMNATEENGFLPLPDETVDADIIYLCSPNNPTGAVYTKEQLQKWVDYANEREAVILFDAAYECFITDPTLPRSIFEIPGAKTCAIEFCSFSKTAGFTGTRCGYTVVPHTLKRGGVSLRQMWLRRQTTKFNGVSYPVQRAAAAVFSPEGLAACRANIAVYQENTRMIGETLQDLGGWYVGGKNSPYIWMQCPDGMTSWDFFDRLLETAHIVGTPGSGFGKNGEGFFRLTGFGANDRTREAMRRLREITL